jgi:hypothetical protein
MATFTMELKDVLERLYGTSMNPRDYQITYEPVIFREVTYGKLPVLPDEGILAGLGTYPIFNPAYRKVLNGKIIDEYFTREIGTETIDNWTLMIRRKMDQIMPYYNKLYLSEEIPYEALATMLIHSVGTSNTDELAESHAVNDTTENVIGNVHAETVGDSTNIADSTARAVQSNTPQTMLAGNEDYATSASDSKSHSDGSATTNQTSDSDNINDTIGNSVLDTDSLGNTKTDTDTMVTGYQGAASDLINKYRNTLLNIDTAVLLELQDCFMGLLNNGDSYSSSNNYYGWAY